jgi:hypothetical protein
MVVDYIDNGESDVGKSPARAQLYRISAASLNVSKGTKKKGL